MYTKLKEKWTICYNHNVFIVDMTTIQHKKFMNNIIKDYLNISISLVIVIIAFQST